MGNGDNKVKLSQIKSLLKRMKSDSIFVEFDKHRGRRQLIFEPKPCLSKSEIISWEAANGVSMPEEFHLFLKEIGNGGVMPASYTDFVLNGINVNNVDTNLKYPFPVTSNSFDQRLNQPENKDDQSKSFFSELDAYLEGDLPPGCLSLGRYPSYDFLFLVVSGELKGTIWVQLQGGIPELSDTRKPVDFLTWLLDVLTELYDINQ